MNLKIICPSPEQTKQKAVTRMKKFCHPQTKQCQTTEKGQFHRCDPEATKISLMTPLPGKHMQITE
jgi:hypothetical protein